MKKPSPAAPSKVSPPKKAPLYRNSALPPARRVKDLLARMTLEEKAAQMMCVWQKKSETLLDEQGRIYLQRLLAGSRRMSSVIDALLGAAALGDIGTYFPPSDEKWRNADSKDLARGAAALVRDAGWVPGNLDCTIVLEKPKLGPLKDAMRASVAACLGMSPDAVSVKAKTKEGVDAVGEGRAVEAAAVVILFAARSEKP